MDELRKVYEQDLVTLHRITGELRLVEIHTSDPRLQKSLIETGTHLSEAKAHLTNLLGRL